MERSKTYRTETYSRWNDAIAEEYFSAARAGRPV
jgi:hypothetical protein